MSDAQHNNQADHEVHEGPIKTPKQLIAAVVASFVVPVVAIIMLANFVDFSSRSGAGSDGATPQAVAARIQPVGRVEIKDASDLKSLKSGEQVVQAQCASCHTAGLLKAPKLGDEADWGPRIKTGYEALLTAALKGKGAMAAQGGGEFSDVEIGRAVVFMANKAGGKLAEPALPAAPTAAAATAAPASATK